MSGVLVDTSVWSEFLRRGPRKRATDHSLLSELVVSHQVAMIGPVRQELLSGIKSAPQFEALRNHLRSFPDQPIETEDYELAADFFNRCRGAGIQGSYIDFLICAVASRNNFQIFARDRDFTRYAKHVPIRLFQPAAR